MNGYKFHKFIEPHLPKKLDEMVFVRVNTPEMIFDIDELPAADYTIISTPYYEIPIDDWVRYIDRLKNKTRYAIVVSSNNISNKHWRAHNRLGQIGRYFKGWREHKQIVESESWTCLWSKSFKSELKRVKIKSIDFNRNRPNYKDVSKYINDIKENGLREPPIIRGGSLQKLCDGGRRLSALIALGYKTVIVRKLW